MRPGFWTIARLVAFEASSVVNRLAIGPLVGGGACMSSVRSVKFDFEVLGDGASCRCECSSVRMLRACMG